jgi:lysophospholipase L1-like esterase
MAVKFSADLNTKSFENKLKIFSSSLGGIFKELMETVGKEMVEETKGRTTFANRTGKLFNAINFISTDTGGILTTRKTLNKSNVWYARMVEKDRNIKPKKAKYLTFKINGEWKKVSSIRVRGRPFMTPVFDEYWEGPNAKGYKALADALQKKLEDVLN